MNASLIIIGALIVVGAICYIHHRLTAAKAPLDASDRADSSDESDPSKESECCGMHITCERDSLLTAFADGAQYYDDEELDRFRGRPNDGYTPAETEEFRDVLLTLRPEDIAGWARSVQMRGIELPADVRDELLMIVAEARAEKTKIKN